LLEVAAVVVIMAVRETQVVLAEAEVKTVLLEICHLAALGLVGRVTAVVIMQETLLPLIRAVAVVALERLAGFRLAAV
jgi:hypothetical protein